MNKIERQHQRETDEEILSYVRGMQSLAPVSADAVYSYLKRTARRRVTQMDVTDRLAYLKSAGYLEGKKAWDQGEWVHFYEITANGMDLLDGNIPPRIA